MSNDRSNDILNGVRAHFAPRRVTIEAPSGQPVILRGQVESFYQKQIVIKVTQEVCGRVPIDDRLEVDEPQVVAR